MNQLVKPPKPLDVLKERIALLEKFERQIRIALKHGGETHSFDNVCERVLTDDLYVLTNGTALILAEFVQFPNYATLHGYIACGELKGILAMSDDFDALARSLQCKRVTLAGRKGWLRALTQLGWKPSLYIMDKEL